MCDGIVTLAIKAPGGTKVRRESAQPPVNGRLRPNARVTIVVVVAAIHGQAADSLYNTAGPRGA